MAPAPGKGGLWAWWSRGLGFWSSGRRALTQRGGQSSARPRESPGHLLAAVGGMGGCHLPSSSRIPGSGGTSLHFIHSFIPSFIHPVLTEADRGPTLCQGAAGSPQAWLFPQGPGTPSRSHRGRTEVRSEQAPPERALWGLRTRPGEPGEQAHRGRPVPRSCGRGEQAGGQHVRHR